MTHPTYRELIQCLIDVQELVLAACHHPAEEEDEIWDKTYDDETGEPILDECGDGYVALHRLAGMLYRLRDAGVITADKDDDYRWKINP